MTVSKRTRFEVLRRDNHACQYCGQIAPDVILHVDHVIPVALGGSDKPDNLVAACKDCNAGKASISPDSPIVATVALRSAEYALANANRNAQIEADLSAMEQYQEEFGCLWPERTYLPEGWRDSLSAWWKTGVPQTLIASAVTTAIGARKVSGGDKFRYFAGVVWRTLDEYDQRYSAQTNEGRVYGPTEMENYGIQEWQNGHNGGIRQAARDARKADLVANHIDRSLAELFETVDYY